MGFWSKLLADTRATSSAATPTAPQLQPWWLAGRGRVDVVGESHYQDALRAYANGHATTYGDGGIPLTAALVREPRNPHDRNAVRIDVQRRAVGYLARELAVQYAPLLDCLAESGRMGLLHGRAFGGGGRSYGVWLDLADAEEGFAGLVPVNQPPGGLAPLPPSRRVAITGEEAHQDVLERYGPLGEAATTVFGTFAWFEVTKGKHAGNRGIEVRIDGSRVGALTPAMTTRYQPLLGAALDVGRSPWAEVRVFAEKGLSAEVFLPVVA